jgi:NTE family protein
MSETTLQLGLVLSGGAARGAYQMGIWQALRELDLEKNIKIVTGASVGAINGALMIQGDWDVANDLWVNAQPEEAFDCLSEKNAMGYWALLPDGLRNGGIRVNGLKKLLRNALNEEKIRTSNKAFGLVVYNWSLRKGQSFFKEEIPQDLLADYIIASASFPAFQAHEINGEKFIDGGIYKILPVDMAFDHQSLDLVIGIDVAEASKFLPEMWSIKQKYGDKLMYLRPSKTLPSPLNFSVEARKFQIEVGYQDGLAYLSALPEKIGAMKSLAS